MTSEAIDIRLELIARMNHDRNCRIPSSLLSDEAASHLEPGDAFGRGTGLGGVDESADHDDHEHEDGLGGGHFCLLWVFWGRGTGGFGLVVMRHSQLTLNATNVSRSEYSCKNRV